MSKLFIIQNLISEKDRLEELVFNIDEMLKETLKPFIDKRYPPDGNWSATITLVHVKDDYVHVYVEEDYGCQGSDWNSFYIPVRYIDRKNLDRFRFHNVTEYNRLKEGRPRTSVEFSRSELLHDDEINKMEDEIKQMKLENEKEQKRAQYEKLKKEFSG